MRNQEKNQKSQKLVMILSILLIAAILFIAVTQIIQAKQKIYKQGMQAGYEFAITQIIQQLLTCNPVPLYMGNVTVNAIAVECTQNITGT